MISSIESHIHVEVLKIYPKAELPTFEVLEKKTHSLVIVYKSSRAMYAFAMGLMVKTFEHFNSSVDIVYDKIKADGTEVKFTVTTINEPR